MKEIEQSISTFVENQFPAFYKTEGNTFIAFVKAYFEWLETFFQQIHVEQPDGFLVGDIIKQTQFDDTIAEGEIYAISDAYFLVKTTSWDPFRCETYCNVLSEVINERGDATRIIKQARVNPIYHARNLFQYRDIDTTIDSFILNFKEKYLKNIQFNTATNKKLLVKNSLDLYRSKGTERAIDLFFKLVYNKNANVYYPGDDIFTLSSGDWYKPRYLEISESVASSSFVGKTIEGLSSGATAFVEKFIRRKVTTGYINVLYITNITGEFVRGEVLSYDTIRPENPKVLGSLTYVEVLSGGSNYTVGDIVDIIDQNGQFGQARVVSVKTNTGEVEFLFYSGGYGYSISPKTYLSDKILQISNLASSDDKYFSAFDQFTQQTANLNLAFITSNTIPAEAELYQYHGNGDIKAEGLLISSALSPIYEVSSNTSNASVLTLVSGTTESISAGDYILGSSNTQIVNTDQASIVTAVINATALESNSTLAVVNGTVQVAVSSTNTVGSMSVFVSNAMFETGEIYTAGNTELGFVSSVLDKTVTGTIIKVPSTLTLSVANSIGTFNVSDELYQLDGPTEVANGIITYTNISGGVGSIEVGPYFGVFDKTLDLLSRSNTGQAALESISTQLPIEFNREHIAEVTVDTSIANASTLIITAGSTAGLQPRDQLLFSTNTSVVDHNVGAEIESIINSTSVSMTADVAVANGTSVVTFLDITDNDLIANSILTCNTPTTSFSIDSISLGSGADYALVNVELKEDIFINTDLLSGVNIYGVPYMQLPLDSLAFGFPKDPSANIESYVISALTFEQFQIGSITDVITTNPGTDYNMKPEAVVIEPVIAAMNLQDYILEVEEVPGSFKSGDVLTQDIATIDVVELGVANILPFIIGEEVFQGTDIASSTANGIVYIANVVSGSLTLVNSDGVWVDTDPVKSYVTSNSIAVTSVTSGNSITQVAKGTVTRTVLGSNTTTLYVSRESVPSFIVSGPTVSSDLHTANIVSVGVDYTSIPIGLNANVEANVITTEGSVSNLEIITSGFGYPNNSIVDFTNEQNGSVGTARTLIDSYGTGQGRYRNTKGFLSSNKFLFDGTYYQEYSYEVLTSLSFDKYSDIFKNVMHVAGTALFGSVLLQDTGQIPIQANEVEVISSL